MWALKQYTLAHFQARILRRAELDGKPRLTGLCKYEHGPIVIFQAQLAYANGHGASTMSKKNKDGICANSIIDLLVSILSCTYSSYVCVRICHDLTAMTLASFSFFSPLTSVIDSTLRWLVKMEEKNSPRSCST